MHPRQNPARTFFTTEEWRHRVETKGMLAESSSPCAPFPPVSNQPKGANGGNGEKAGSSMFRLVRSAIPQNRVVSERNPSVELCSHLSAWSAKSAVKNLVLPETPAAVRSTTSSAAARPRRVNPPQAGEPSSGGRAAAATTSPPYPCRSVSIRGYSPAERVGSALRPEARLLDLALGLPLRRVT